MGEVSALLEDSQEMERLQTAIFGELEEYTESNKSKRPRARIRRKK